MDRADSTVSCSRRAQPLARGHHLSGPHGDFGEVGDGGAEPSAVIDGHGEHAGHRSGEGDGPSACCPDGLAFPRLEVDPMMPLISTDGRVFVHHGTSDRRT